MNDFNKAFIIGGMFGTIVAVIVLICFNVPYLTIIISVVAGLPLTYLLTRFIVNRIEKKLIKGCKNK